MTGDRRGQALERALRAARAPDEDEAAARSLDLARAAFRERQPLPRRRRGRRVALALVPALVLGAGVAALGAAEPLGLQLDAGLHRLRVAVAPPPQVDRLPAPGRILAASSRTISVIGADGRPHRLGRYRDATWSPHGLFVVARSAHELVALDPNGPRQWRIRQPDDIVAARWSSGDGFRVAYVAGGALRVANGDGTGDRPAAVAVAPVAPSWRPQRGGRRVLAYAARDGSVVALDVDSGAALFHTRPGPRPSALQWTGDGARLMVVRLRRVDAFDPAGRPAGRLTLPAGSVTGPVAAARRGRSAVLVRRQAAAGASSVVVLRLGGRRASFGRTLLTASGGLTSLAWSPDGRFLAVASPFADAWFFVPLDPRGRRVTLGEVTRRLGAGSFPQVRGWVPASRS